MKALLFFVTACLCLSLHAKSFIREYTYRAGEADSKITARAIALEQVKRLLLEEVGVYIQSSIQSRETETNGQVSDLTVKDIQVLSAGITQTKVLTENWTGETYSLKAEIVLDESDVLTRLDDLITNVKSKEALEQNRITTDAALSEMERLKAELEQEKDKNRQLQLQQEYATEAGKLSAVEYFEKGSELSNMDADNFQQAADWFQKAVEADSTFADAWLNLGQCHYFLDNFGQAKSCLQKSYALNNSSDALVWIGNCYSGLKDYATALTYYQRSYEQSQNLVHLANVADCYSNMQDYEQAKVIYEQILALDPDNFTATNYGSLVYLNLKEYDRAIACHLKLIELGADPASQYDCIASAYNDAGDYPNAIKYYRIVVDLEPDVSYHWSYLALAYYNSGDMPQAITAFQRLLTISGSDPWAENLLGKSYENLNDQLNSCKYHLLAAQHGNTESQEWCTGQNIKW